MKILVVNDDGYESKGLNVLVKALTRHGDIYVSAPCSEQSAKSHGITIDDKIVVKDVPNIEGAVKTIAVCGSPADATRVGLKVFNESFDLVVSGINDGRNIAQDIIYSGTVAAAMEASYSGVHAVAISADNLEVDYLLEETTKLICDIINNKTYKIDGVLNINFPKHTYLKPKGVVYTTQGKRQFVNEFIKSDNHEELYNIDLSINDFQEDKTSDVKAFDEGYISITPLTLYRTCYNTFNKLLDK